MIREEEWLSKAKQLAVGMRSRVFHLNERRPNLAIGNDMDKWWCYCHACHKGAVVEKAHVILGVTHNEVHDAITLPRDIVPVHQTEFEVQVARFLADKNMALPYLPELYYSAERKRLMLLIEGKYHGRDLTGRSPQKWMNYGNRTFVGSPFTYTVVVEDLFSMFKVRWAMRQYPNVSAMCNLGTNAGQNITAALMASKSMTKLGWFFDADPAGDRGAHECQKRMHPFGFQQYRIRPPEGLDPKDMSCEEIRAAILKEMRL